MGKSIASLEKGFDILSFYDYGNEALSAKVISTKLNIPLSSTYRYLETLEQKGFLVRNQNTYELGLKLLKLGTIVSSRLELPKIVLPYMKSLATQSRETALLTAISGWEVICIERVETQQLIKLSLERGSTLPLYAGASSKILLAYQGDSFVDYMLRKVTLTKFTKFTITDPLKLKKELSIIRKQGFAFSNQEVDLGAIAIGAPLFDHKGKVVAGLTVAGPRERINDKKKAQLIEMVKEFAQKASHELGYRAH